MRMLKKPIKLLNRSQSANAAPAGPRDGGTPKLSATSTVYSKAAPLATSITEATAIKNQIGGLTYKKPVKVAFRIKPPPHMRTVSAPNRHKSHNLQVAKEFATLGLSIFPCGPDKKPLVKWGTESTTDQKIIAKWWRDHPDALPAIDIAKSDLIVIDADRHGADDGVAALKKLLAPKSLHQLHAPMVSTPRNGLHLYFRQPKGQQLKNRRGDLPKGVDVRGVGGYVIAPGAVRVDGRAYRTGTLSPTLSNAVVRKTLPVLPEILAKLLRKAPPAAVSTPSKVQSPRTNVTSRELAYAAAALKEIAQELASTKHGERNDKLNKSAFCLGTMLARGWIDRSAIVDRLTAACRKNSYVQDKGMNSVKATLASGINAGLKEPHPDRQPLRQLVRKSPAQASPGSSGLDTKCAADVKPEKIRWIWPGRIARGKHTISWRTRSRERSRHGIDCCDSDNGR